LGKDKGPIIDTHGRLYWLSLLKVFRFYYIPMMVNKHDITIGMSVNMPRLCTLAVMFADTFVDFLVFMLQYATEFDE